MKWIAAVSFIAGAVAANWLTSRYGLIPVGFGLVTTAGTYAAGLVLLVRDWLQDTGGRWWVVACIAVGAALSTVLAGPALGVASGAAFAVSELADAAVYTPLRRRGWVLAAVASGVVGSLVDTVLFLWLAGFPVWSSAPGQMVAKLTATVVPVLVVVVSRAFLRNRLRAEGA